MRNEEEMLDDVEYKNGRKNNWRRALWNALKSHRPNHDRPDDRVILYLPGEQDLDRKVALEKGFKSHNLIAIERNKDIVKRLRGRGVICIHSDLFSVMHGWRSDTPIFAILADTQTNFSDAALKIIALWFCGIAFRRTVLLMNLQRGRERGKAGEYLHKYLEEPSANDGIAKNHRVMMALQTAALHYASFAAEKRNATDAQLHEWRNQLMNTVIFGTIPSYRSNKVVFDSALLCRFAGTESWNMAEGVRNEATAKIAAALAVRTMKMRH